MAEITKIQTFIEEEEEEDNDLVNIDQEEQYFPYTFNFLPFFTPFSSSASASASASCHHNHDDDDDHKVISNSSSSCCLSEPESETHYPDCLYAYDDDEEYDQMGYVTDLFQETRFSVINNDNNNHELELGLRATGIESESDVEELAQVNDGYDDTHDVNLDHFWECPSFDTHRIVEERNGQEGLSSVIDRIEEISVSSEISSDGDAAVGVLEWEILLAVNNLERDLELETDGGEGGFVYTPEFDTLIGQFVETVRALRGSPPAAKSFVDSLPLVVLNKGGVNEDDDHEICAVCKDEILIEEKVTQLPCRHHYHGECIVPWLSIRNTCPVCRFELPTDDVDYERSKNRENDDDELRVGSGFELSP